MLDRLPAEILHIVLDLAATWTAATPENAEVVDRSTLQACSIVCRSVCRVAQPLLWKHVELANEGQADDFEWLMAGPEADELSRMVRVLSLTGASITFDAMEHIVEALPLLEELHLSWHRLTHLTLRGFLWPSWIFPACPALKHLDMRDTHRNAECPTRLVPSLSLPSLETLLLDLQSTDEVSDGFLSANTLPSLRRLVLYSMYTEDLPEAFPPIEDQLVAQLELLQLSLGELPCSGTARSLLDGFCAAAEQQGVEVVWRAEETESVSMSGLSGFARWARRKMEAEKGAE
ncbi:hypothetical protein JCM10213v2_005253 [Rhodosporidiobolus nylandii]